MMYHTGLHLGLAQGFGHTSTQMLFVRSGEQQLNHCLDRSEFTSTIFAPYQLFPSEIQL